VWFSEWELKPGDSIGAKIERALEATDQLIVLLSPHSVSSKWVKYELESALAREVTNRGVTVIPAVVADCEIPPLLASRQYADLRSDFNAGVRQLVREISLAPAIDFSKLSPAKFEELIGELLLSLGFTVERAPRFAAKDSGVDFFASIKTTDPFGMRQAEVWLVETKFYSHERVGVATLAQMVGVLTARPGRNRGLVITNGEITSVAARYLADVSGKSSTDLRIIGATELRRLLQMQPRLVEKYFSREVAK
jgi:hypothetical protein